MRRVLGLVLAAVAVGLYGAPAGAHPSDSSCTYDAGTVRLHLASEHVVRLSAINGRIEYADLADYSRKGQCGAATVANTDLVVVTESVPGTSRLQFGPHYGRFGPGRTPESTGVSEIEVELGTLTQVWLMASQAADSVFVGTRGINVNGDDDVDLIGSSLGHVSAFLEDGNDFFSGWGGRGTGDPWRPAPGDYMAVSGNDGNDIIYGTPGRDLLAGEWGDDKLYGLGGNDDLDGGSEHDTIWGAGGADVIDGGYGFDTVDAGLGDDIIRAHDHTADTLQGGDGHDRAWVDDQDSSSGIEVTTLGAW